MKIIKEGYLGYIFRHHEKLNFKDDLKMLNSFYDMSNSSAYIIWSGYQI